MYVLNPMYTTIHDATYTYLFYLPHNTTSTVVAWYFSTAESAGAQLHVAISFQSRHTVYTTTNVCTRYCSGVDSFFYLVIAFTSDNTSIRTAKNFGSSLFPLQFLTDRFVVNYIENQIAELLLYLRTQQQQYNHKSFASISLCATNSRSSRRSSKRRKWKRPKQEHLYML